VPAKILPFWIRPAKIFPARTLPFGIRPAKPLPARTLPFGIRPAARFSLKHARCICRG
jgi:hypothetical protein